MRVLIAGGGTGGHVYPGIAVAHELAARRPDAEVVFVGTVEGIESRVVPAEGFPLDVIRSAGLKGQSLGAILRALALLPISAIDAWRVLSARRPMVVIGVGGYSSGPIVLLAALRGVPTLLLEQNAMPGLTNRLLSRVVDAAALTYEESAGFFRGNAFVAGNPVRPQFFRAAEDGAGMGDDASRAAVTLLVIGGSQGAHAINVAMVDAVSRLAAARPHLAITHQTGERDLDMVREAYRRVGVAARVESFLFGMDREMRRADLIVCRAGATTIAEVAAAALPSILIPLPTSTDDHQRKNGLALAASGAARMLDQQDLTGDRLADEILGLCRDEAARGRMSEAARRLARPDAARLIVDRVLALAAA